MCSGDENPPSCSTEARPRARKVHRCCECRLPIPVGATYVNTSGIWDGHADRFKQHVECHDLLDQVSKEMCGGEPWTFGSLGDELNEYATYPEAAPLRAKYLEICAKYSEDRP